MLPGPLSTIASTTFQCAAAAERDGKVVDLFQQVDHAVELSPM